MAAGRRTLDRVTSWEDDRVTNRARSRVTPLGHDSAVGVGESRGPCRWLNDRSTAPLRSGDPALHPMMEVAHPVKG